jgi:hypothetical protein
MGPEGEKKIWEEARDNLLWLQSGLNEDAFEQRES